ncbi:MAG: hypothetical protein RR620_08615 [Clostridium sp.]
MEKIELNELILFKDIIDGVNLYSIYHEPTDSSIAFENISQIKEYLIETGNEPYFSNHSLISAYYLVINDILATPDDLIFDLECSIVGKCPGYDVSCLSDFIDNDLGYGFLDLDFNSMKNYISERIRQLIIK